MRNEIINKLLQLSEQEHNRHPEWRKGQSIINCTYIYCEHLTKDFMHTKVDCFYKDSLINDFLKSLEEKIKTSEPFVEIFWFYNGFVIFPHAVQLTNGLHYGNTITGTKDHADYWDELAGHLSFLPSSLRKEYFSIPRGRVVYHKDTDHFHILHGNNLMKKDLQQVIKNFCLPKERTVFEIDTHYCDYTPDEWNLLMNK